MKEDESTYDYDVLVVGSGFGGSVTALRLTEKGYRVGVLEAGRRFAVIGGGFIGSEIAAALAINGKQVVMAFPDSSICARVFPPDLSQFLNRYFQEKGVEIISGDTVESITGGVQPVLQLKAKGELPSDGVVAGLGIQPNLGLAQAAGLEIRDGGIAVDEQLRTSAPGVYSAGDVAMFYNPTLNKFLRVEHEDNALRMGEAAGRSMAGEKTAYRHLPFFYSDLFDLGYEAVGELDPQLEIVADWAEPYKKGIVYYLKAGRVRGVLAWNIFGRMDKARLLIAEPGPFGPADLKNRLAA